jgi:hypothetical protein
LFKIEEYSILTDSSLPVAQLFPHDSAPFDVYPSFVVHKYTGCFCNSGSVDSAFKKFVILTACNCQCYKNCHFSFNQCNMYMCVSVYFITSSNCICYFVDLILYVLYCLIWCITTNSISSSSLGLVMDLMELNEFNPVTLHTYMTIRPFTQSVINCYWTAIPAQGLFLKLDVSKEFGTGWYCNSKTDVILCDYYKLWCYLFIC